MPVEIFSIRHGKTESSPRGKILPDKIWDAPLNDLGLQQSEALWDQIPADTETIYCPRFLRFTQTAEAIRKKLPHIKIVVNSQIEGTHFGELGGLTWAEVAQKYGPQLEKDFKNHVYDFRPYGGESYLDINERLTNFIHQYRHVSGKLVMITSGGINRSLYKMILDQSFEAIPSGSVNKFIYTLPAYAMTG